jgi:hypothetical protein
MPHPPQHTQSWPPPAPPSHSSSPSPSPSLSLSLFPVPPPPSPLQHALRPPPPPPPPEGDSAPNWRGALRARPGDPAVAATVSPPVVYAAADAGAARRIRYA